MTYSIELSFEQPLPERVRCSAAASAGGMPARQALAGHRWTDDQQDQCVAAYLYATPGRAERQGLHNDAMRLQQERARTSQLSQPFGRSSVLAAENSARAGITARQSAAQTHWGSDAEPMNFVDAYVEVTAGHPEWWALHDDAVAYVSELHRPGQEAKAQERRRLLKWLRAR
jgi:hypothetical protein